MLDDVADGEWTYRRDPRIRRAVGELDGPASDQSRRVLAPEVQLLYKSKNPRPKDEAGLLAVLPHLDADQSSWLADALSLVSPDHPWMARL
ncbi:hypothetical protein ACFP3Q_05575 [Nocardioides sp. GCM10027113]|uniref:hypothetical protein n=1 Tax=unclassified Nocardioides TaxID=2615069 RepID=UPI003621737B